MNFKIDFSEDKVVATFTEYQEEGDITSAFLEIISTVNIKEIKCIIFDCTKAVDYNFPVDYMTRVRVLTRFSTTWNEDVQMIFIATNPQIRYMVSGFMNHSDDLKWKYHLFKTLKEALQLF